MDRYLSRTVFGADFAGPKALIAGYTHRTWLVCRNLLFFEL
jgi:hypothetical protein